MKQRPCRQCRTPFAVVNGGQRYCRNCQGKRTAYLAKFRTLDDQKQNEHLAFALAWLVWTLRTVVAEEKRIDATAAELLLDVNI